MLRTSPPESRHGLTLVDAHSICENLGFRTLEALVSQMIEIIHTGVAIHVGPILETVGLEF